MNEDTLKQMLDKISEDYVLEIVSWANVKANSKKDAEEISQQIFIRVLKNIINRYNNGDGIDNLDHYIWRIAYTTFRKYVLSQDVNEFISSDMLEGNLDETDQKNSEILNNMLVTIKEKVTQTNALYNEVILLYYIEKLSSLEIALILKLSENRVRKILHIGM
jgi:RNA polymerase sigma-70 factor (ECF subfamily)